MKELDVVAYEIDVLYSSSDVLHGFHRAFPFHVSTVESLLWMGSSVEISIEGKNS